MKNADLLLRLQQLPPDAEVLAFNADTWRLQPITGYVSEHGGSPTIELCTDDMNAAPGAPEPAEKRARRLNAIIDEIEQHLMGAPREVLAAEIQDIDHMLQRMAWPGDRRALTVMASSRAYVCPCPAAGMKPDACSDRSQCLEACGPLGQIPQATCTVHLPNGLMHACERHASTARLQAGFLGSHAYVDQAADGTPCTYCAARAAG